MSERWKEISERRIELVSLVGVSGPSRLKIDLKFMRVSEFSHSEPPTNAGSNSSRYLDLYCAWVEIKSVQHCPGVQVATAQDTHGAERHEYAKV